MGSQRATRWGAALLVFNLALPAQAHVRDAFARLRDQASHIVTSPLRMTWTDALAVVTGAAVMGLTIAYDTEIHRHTTALREWSGRDALETTGDVLQFGGLIGAAALATYGQLRDDRRAIDHARLQLDAAGWAAGTGQVMKLTAGRERRRVGRPREFEPFSGHDSWPSGHTLSAFTAAWLAVEEYESPLVRGGALLLASTVGVSRLTARKHFVGDVAGGAVVGTGLARLLHGYERRRKAEAESPRLNARIGPTAAAIVWRF